MLPTGSLKDRSVTVALTHARAVGARAVGVSSSGNHAASVAAYAAAAGLPAVVMVPAATSPAKILQARAHGATLIAVRASYDVTAALFKEALKAFGWYSCLSTNPWRNEGKKSYAFEVWEDLHGETPDWMVHPIGGRPRRHRVLEGLAGAGRAGLGATDPAHDRRPARRRRSHHPRLRGGA